MDSYFRALKLGDAARVAPIDKLSVVFVSVFAMSFLGERLIALGAVLVVEVISWDAASVGPGRHHL